MSRLFLLSFLFFISDLVSALFSDCKASGLHQHFSFPVGLALDSEKLKFSEKYWQLAIKEFNSFSPERILKASFIQPLPEQFAFQEIDELMRFCEERNIRLHGHTLIWHRELPRWMHNKHHQPEEISDIMCRHIDTVVKHCKGKIASWDVVNEAFNDDGSFRETIWFNKTGQSYIRKAFQTAQTADPAALLFYNDYGLEVPGPKLDAVLAHLRKLRAEGIRIDGIGLQMHISLNSPREEELKEACRLISDAGFRLHFSELDVRLNKPQTTIKKKADLLMKQSERYRFVFQLFQTLPPDQQFGITLWGLSDKDSWLSEDSNKARPLLFDNEYMPKPAYCALMSLGTVRK